MKIAIAAALLVAAASCAPVAPGRAPATPRQCFEASDLIGFQIVDRDTIDLEVGPREFYRAELFGACLGLEEAVRVGVRGRGGSGWVCHGADAAILLPQSPVGPQSCRARSIRQLTQAEVEALQQR